MAALYAVKRKKAAKSAVRITAFCTEAETARNVFASQVHCERVGRRNNRTMNHLSRHLKRNQDEMSQLYCRGCCVDVEQGWMRQKCCWLVRQSEGLQERQRNK